MAQGTSQPGSAAFSPPGRLPVVIIGAGISGLLLAQHLRQQGIPLRIFERDTNLETRGVGWGLTLNWSLPMLKSLVSPELLSRLPEAYVDHQCVASGLVPRFPFFDLSTGELKATTPPLPDTVRVRVTRERLRRWLSTDLDIEVSKHSLLLGVSGTFHAHQDMLVPDGNLLTESLLLVGKGFQVVCGNSQQLIWGRHNPTPRRAINKFSYRHL
jgi:hypothetical protein